MLGKSLGHYTITDLLGRGGMGEVYRAHDTRLERDVALKVLPPAMASDPEGLERFEREAKAVAALNHPHIVTLHSVEQDGEHRFLTMELVEGAGLDQGLPAGGLPVARVVEIGIAIADALAAAHEKGIVHRDLKPANIMVTSDGRVKVLDFGLAKLAPAGTGEPEEVSLDGATVTQAAPLTAVGTFLGTAPYMSPEQVRGQEVDSRSDLFSLGVVLYELATGERPFQGSTMSDVVSSILRDSPQPLEKRRPEAPKPLGRILEHCLAKEPGERPASAREVRDELRGLQARLLSGAVGPASTADDEATVVRRPPEPRGSRGAVLALAGVALVLAVVGLGWWLTRDGAPSTTEVAATPDRTIAVLPFANQSDDPEQEYFSDGISEELLNLLTQVPQLRVTSRSSSFSFKGKNVEISEIAE